MHIKNLTIHEILIESALESFEGKMEKNAGFISDTFKVFF